MPTLLRVLPAILPFVCVLAAIPMASERGAASAVQEKPNYSGTWTAIAEPNATGSNQPVRLFGQEFVVRHDGPKFAITRGSGETTMTTIHLLDGSETRTRRPGRLCESDSEFVHTASWDGNSVQIAMVGMLPPGGGPLMKREVKWMVRMTAPDTMTVEIVPAPGAQPTARAASTTYKRTGAPPAATPPSSGTPKTPATIAQAAWLPGVWVGTRGSSTIEERWTPAAGSMLAVARTISSNVMGSFEFLCIVEREGSLVYQAMPNGRQPATDFALTRIEGESLTFENPAHDFPKMIRYTKQADGSLEAVISGDAKSKPITFVFKKQ